MKKLPLIAILAFLSCSGDGIFRDVQGIIKSTSPTTVNVPGNPTPTISVLGRNPDEFKIDFIQASLNTPVANFIIHGIPTKQPVVFQITSASFDPVVSFPYDLKTTSSITLPGLEAGTTANIIDEIQTLTGQTVTSTAGLVLGQLNSTGSAAGGCSDVSSVEIKDKGTGQNVSILGPFYFNQNGHVVNSSHFEDTQCNYVMANVLPGVYILVFNDSSAAKVKEHEVIVLPGNVSFGMDVP